MATLRDMAAYSWEGMTGWQKLVVVAVPLILMAFLVAGWVQSIGTSMEIRRLEREKNAAIQAVKKHLETAAKIAREKLELQQKLAEIEAKRDAKITEAEAANLKTLDALAEYERTIRERRGDDPTRDQLCAELRALGYACE